MITVRDLLITKGRKICFVSLEDAVIEILNLMIKKDIVSAGIGSGETLRILFKKENLSEK